MDPVPDKDQHDQDDDKGTRSDCLFLQTHNRVETGYLHKEKTADWLPALLKVGLTVLHIKAGSGYELQDVVAADLEADQDYGVLKEGEEKGVGQAEGLQLLGVLPHSDLVLVDHSEAAGAAFQGLVGGRFTGSGAGSVSLGQFPVGVDLTEVYHKEYYRQNWCKILLIRIKDQVSYCHSNYNLIKQAHISGDSSANDQNRS